MAQQNLFDKIREWIGGIAWDIFLWSARMTEDEYLDAVTRAAEHRNEADESIPAACHELHEQWMKLYNFCPECGTRVTPLS